MTAEKAKLIEALIVATVSDGGSSANDKEAFLSRLSSTLPALNQHLSASEVVELRRKIGSSVRGLIVENCAHSTV